MHNNSIYRQGSSLDSLDCNVSAWLPFSIVTSSSTPSLHTVFLISSPLFHSVSLFTQQALLSAVSLCLRLYDPSEHIPHQRGQHYLPVHMDPLMFQFCEFAMVIFMDFGGET
jgi:hypothetical protein